MMVVGKEDLGLSLSLACNTTTTTNNNNNNIASTTSLNNNMINNNNNNISNHKNHHHHMGGFMMMMKRNNNINHHHHHHHQTTPSSTNNNNNTSSPLQLNLMINPSLSSSISTPPAASASASFLQKLPWNRSTDSFPPSDRNSDTCRSFLRGIDVNRPAGAGGSAGDEDDAGVSSPNSTVSTVSGKRSHGERDSAGAGDDIEVERASSRGLSDDEDGGENSRKKLRLTKDQSAILEESFKEHNTLNPKQKLALAKRLGLRPRQVEVWFQNRRARTKLKQTEVDCEFLKRCCEQLTEENRRLQKEVQELRALKLSPQFYMQMTPPTTLTMCPSCERVAVPPNSSTSSSAVAQAQAKAHPAPDSRPSHRPMAVNPWVAAPVPIRPFEALRPRS